MRSLLKQNRISSKGRTTGSYWFSPRSFCKWMISWGITTCVRILSQSTCWDFRRSSDWKIEFRAIRSYQFRLLKIESNLPNQGRGSQNRHVWVLRNCTEIHGDRTPANTYQDHPLWVFLFGGPAGGLQVVYWRRRTDEPAIDLSIQCVYSHAAISLSEPDEQWPAM